MSEGLLSVGLDVGTSTTQLVVSRLTVENRASGFAVPEMEIARREILYKSPVFLTPLAGQSLVDGPGIRSLLEQEYQKAGIRRQDVDTGAIIITGETSRRENARAVLDALAELAGDFVVATAGPDLESVLAAKGAGALAWSEETGKPMLHMDIGGGTSNLALIREGRIVRTGCLNVGGRLIKLGESGEITYVSPVLQGISSLKAGQIPDREALAQIAQRLNRVLEMAAGRRPRGPELDDLTTRETGRRWEAPEEDVVVSLSGGVAACVEADLPWDEFGDLGPLLGQKIREGALWSGPHRISPEAIRATVIGAGCHAAQLSGSTVFHRNVVFPLKNLPAVCPGDPSRIREAMAGLDGPGVLALPGFQAPAYPQVSALAEQIAAQIPGPVTICLEADMAKALGHALAARLPRDRPILCIDRVKLTEGSYLDVGAPLGSALPVVVKTLVLAKEEG